jgi:acetolactate synthase-1/2/3 large subunit
MSILKPVFLLGNGLRGNPKLVESLCRLNVPVLTTWQACDLVPEDSPVFCGRPGVIGQRAANIIQQKCNWLMVVGARLDMEQVGHNLENFAPNAYKTVLDVDPAELEKYPKTWARYMTDLKSPFDGRYGGRLLPFVSGDLDWLAECKGIYNRFRHELDGSNEVQGTVDPYSFIQSLSIFSREGDVLVPGSSGMQSCAFLQAFKVKKDQRVLVCNTIGAMGMEPMAIGAAIATGRRVIVVTGDGGFAQNIQELEVVARRSLPIHYFVFDNAGYGSIATTQDTRFGLRVGSTEESGFSLPALSKIAGVWNFPFDVLCSNLDLYRIGDILSYPCPTITSVWTSLEFRYACKVMSNVVNGVLTPDRMEDMTPKLDPKELEEIMK